MDVGDLAPDFELLADDGTARRLSELVEQGPVVLFFYPRAMTPGCTQESCMFRDRGPEFAAFGATRIGISLDPVERQRRFRAKHGFDFPLLSDPKGAVARSFGVKRSVLPVARRVTFVIGADRRILGIVASELDVARHGDEALAVLARHGGSADGS